MRVGKVLKVLVECAGETGFTGLEFFTMTTTTAIAGEHNSRGKKYRSQDQRAATQFNLNRTSSSTAEISDERILETRDWWLSGADRVNRDASWCNLAEVCKVIRTVPTDYSGCLQRSG